MARRAAPADREDLAAAIASAERSLAGAMLSVQTLTRRLVLRGFAPDTAGAAVERMRAAGLVDDGQLAGSIASSRSTRQGRARIRATLRRRGIADQDAAAALATISDDDEVAACSAALGVALRRRRLSREDLCDRATLARVVASLARAGFPYSVIRHTLTSPR